MSFSYDYYNPTTIHFGKGQINSITKHITKSNKILIVYGGGSIKKNGVYDQLIEVLKDYKYIEFGGVEANPKYETLNQAVEIIKKEHIDFILAVGGGSVIDGAKYLTAAALYEGDAWDFLEAKSQVTKALPLGVILTIPATGSESNMGAVISKEETSEKRFFAAPVLFPKFAILDPSFMNTLSDKQLANGLVDAFVHTCEQYLTVSNTSLIHDGYAETLLKGLVSLARDWNKRRDSVWQENLMLLANQALNGFIGTGVVQDWGTHYIGHELTAFYGLDHAQSLAVVQPQLLRVMSKNKEEKLLQFGREIFQVNTNIEEIIVEIEKLYNSIGVSTNLNDYDIDTKVIENVTRALKKHNMENIGENGNINLETTKKILQMTMK